MPHPSQALDFILPQIRTIFETDHVKLDARMAQLEILEVKYTDIVRGENYNRWRELKHVDLSVWGNVNFAPNKRREQILKNRKWLADANNGLQMNRTI